MLELTLPVETLVESFGVLQSHIINDHGASQGRAHQEGLVPTQTRKHILRNCLILNDANQDFP
jgi:hypothetical protein